ncbi:MAG: hypothetical protein JHD35_20630 [Sphingopyxis sp.]|nr:hypothetical protein [Sphingopyxis sp.]
MNQSIWVSFPMQAIEGRHDGRKILLPVHILRPGHALDLTSVEVMALLDTGATTSGIGEPVINKLGLISYGKKRLKSAREESFVPYYLFKIGLCDNRADPSRDMPSIKLPYIFPETDGFSWSHATDFQVILGMDVLRKCDLNSMRDGRWVLTFG